MSVPSENTHYAETSIGEKFLSIKQLLNRPSRFFRRVSGNETNFVMWPWFRTVTTINTSSGGLVTPNTGGDLFCRLSQMYMYLHGGAKLVISTDGVKPIYIRNIVDQTPTLAQPLTYYGTSTDYVSPGISTNFDTAANSFNNSIVIQEANAHQVVLELPYYANMNCTLMLNSNGQVDTIPTDISNPQSQIQYIQSDATVTAFFRSFPDEFQLSFFIGAPPVLISYT